MQIRANRRIGNYRSWLLIVLVVGAACSFAAYYFTDPYRDYRAWSLKSIELQSVQLTFNQSNLHQVLVELEKLDSRQRSLTQLDEILAGLHWLIVFIDDSEHFQDLFSDFIIFSEELSRSSSYPQLAEIGSRLLVDSLQRAQADLGAIFSADEEGLWDFIGILPIVAQVPEVKTAYFQFYEKRFSHLAKQAYQSEEMTFEQAVKQKNFHVIGDYLIDTSFLHYYRLTPDGVTIPLPPDTFLQHMQSFEKFDYPTDLNSQSAAFSDLAYLATHVVLVMTNYGEHPISADINSQKVGEYINITFPIVRFQLSDLDLLAEYLQSLKILQPTDDPRIQMTEVFILSLQRSDGSWGTAQDFAGEPYDAFHPTWAVLTALIH